MVKRILVTGGSGFIGYNLVYRLLQLGYEVTVLDAAEGFDLPVRFMKGDIRNDALVKRAVRGNDTVVHLAARTGVIHSIANPRLSFSVNFEGSVNVLEVCGSLGVDHIICASTSGALFGNSQKAVDENSVPSPLSPYGASKMAMEAAFTAYSNSYGLDTCILRFSNVYGPYSRYKKNMVNALMNCDKSPIVIYGDGSQIRDFIYVSDLVNGIVKVIEGNITGTFQLGSGIAASVNDLVKTFCAALHKKPKIIYEPFRAGEVHTTWTDISKARAEFGFSPSVPLERGLVKTWDWWHGLSPTLGNISGDHKQEQPALCDRGWGI